MDRPQRNIPQELRNTFRFEVREPSHPNLPEINAELVTPWPEIIANLRWRLSECMIVLDKMDQETRYAFDRTLLDTDQELHEWLQKYSKLRRNNFIAPRFFLEKLILELNNIKNKSSLKILLGVAAQRAINHIDSVADRTYRANPLETTIALAERLDDLLLDVYSKLRVLLEQGKISRRIKR